MWPNNWFDKIRYLFAALLSLDSFPLPIQSTHPREFNCTIRNTRISITNHLNRINCLHSFLVPFYSRDLLRRLTINDPFQSLFPECRPWWTDNSFQLNLRLSVCPSPPVDGTIIVDFITYDTQFLLTNATGALVLCRVLQYGQSGWSVLDRRTNGRHSRVLFYVFLLVLVLLLLVHKDLRIWPVNPNWLWLELLTFP